MKKLLIFDLEGTLVESESPLDSEMAHLLSALLRRIKVAVLSRASWLEFQQQLLDPLADNENLEKLSLFPQCGTQYYHYRSGWERYDSESLPSPAGLDKAHGIKTLQDTLGIHLQEMLFIGDGLFPGGDDHPVTATGVVGIRIRDPHESKRVIEAILACLCGDSHCAAPLSQLGAGLTFLPL